MMQVGINQRGLSGLCPLSPGREGTEPGLAALLEYLFLFLFSAGFYVQRF